MTMRDGNFEIKYKTYSRNTFSFRSDYEGWKLIYEDRIIYFKNVLEVTMRDGNGMETIPIPRCYQLCVLEVTMRDGNLV